MIDLISDTVTLPSKTMLEKILYAKLGDDGRENADGRGEDLTTNQLEDMAVKLTGKEAAILFPTGTMGNTCAVLSWCKPGNKILVEKDQHLFTTEKICFMEDGFRMRPAFYQIDQNGEADISAIREILDREDISLVCIENTHNNLGGKCMSVNGMAQIHALCRERGIPVHMDGARIFNAAEALDVCVTEIAAQCDSVMFCLSKGLGAPIGSLLCGSKTLIRKARQWRKLLGGTMRQSGVAASCGIYALEHNVARLREDRENTQRLAGLLSGAKVLKPDVAPHSNILMFDLSKSAVTPARFLQCLESRGIRAGVNQDTKVRFVFHEGITSADVDYVARQIIEIDRELLNG